jgi:hypothetical protein
MSAVNFWLICCVDGTGALTLWGRLCESCGELELGLELEERLYLKIPTLIYNMYKIADTCTLLLLLKTY